MSSSVNDAEGWFCANVACVLHIGDSDPHVVGTGEWAELPGGVIVSRTVIEGRTYCDFCARSLVLD